MDKRILVAIDMAWREEVSHYLVDSGFHVTEAPTYDDALQHIKTDTLNAVIIVSNWMVSDEDKATELASVIMGNLPSVTLIKKPTLSHAWFDITFDPPKHEYCGVPASGEEIVHFLSRVGVTAE